MKEAEIKEEEEEVEKKQQKKEEGRSRGPPGPTAQLLSLPQLSRENRQNGDE